MAWEPRYGDWELSEPAAPQVRNSLPTIRMPIANPSNEVAAKPAAIDWLNWAQRLTIAILICVVAWMVYRSEFGEFADGGGDRPAASKRLDWASMDRAAFAARSKVYLAAAARASEFRDLQSLVKWQDEALRAARLEAYQPWVDEMVKHLDEDRYDPAVAAELLQRAARDSNW